MTVLTRKADYALLILADLRDHPAGRTARAVADRYGLGRPFVANILKELCHANFVASHRGVKGGYALRPGADRATLADLLAAVGEPFRLTVCSHPAADDPTCALEAGCPVKGPLADVHRRLVAVLGGVTLADLFARPAAAADPPPVVPLGLPDGTTYHRPTPDPRPAAAAAD